MDPPDAQDHSTVNRAIRCRLYPTAEQETVLMRHCADARFVWNACLEQFNWWRPGIKSSPGYNERSHQLTEARAEHQWLGKGSRPVQQQALRDFEKACRKWWGKTHGRPQWRRHGRDESFATQTVTVKAMSSKWAKIRVPKAGWVRLRISRPPPEQFDVVRVTRDGKGRWHASFYIEVPLSDPQLTGAVVGIDMGVTNTITTSDGQMLRAPSMSEHKGRRLKRLQQRLARQQRGSARREKTKRQIAALHQGQRDRRRNWTEVQTTRLIREHDLVAIEDLPVATMVRRPVPRPNEDGTFAPNGAAAKSGLNRSISRQGWSHFRRRLEDKAETSGACVVAVPARNTSRECHACGHTAPENRESQAVFRCVECGHEAHADRNAAENVLARALALAPTPGSGARDAVPARVSRPGAARTSSRVQAYA